MEKISNSAPVENNTKTEAGDIEFSREKPDFVEKIENFDIHNITLEDIEFMNSVIQDTFRNNFPVNPELIDQIPSRMHVLNNDDFIRLRKPETEDNYKDLGFYDQVNDQILINLEKHEHPGALFSTMFHESLHFVSIQSGGGLYGDFLFPDPGEDDEADMMMNDLDKGIVTAVEGVTQLITQANVLGYLGFTPQEQMMCYEPERLVMGEILRPFSTDERFELYFNTPLDLLRVRIEDDFADDYNPDEPTGVFANCVMNIGAATREMEKALESWREDDNDEPIQKNLKNIRHAVGRFIICEHENGRRKLYEGEKEYLRDYLESE